MAVNIINMIASIGTVVALLLVIISKLILVSSTKKSLIGNQRLDYYSGEAAGVVYDEWIVDGSEVNGPMCIQSSIGLKDLKVYRINDDSGDPLSEPILVSEYDFLPANMTLVLHIAVPEGFPLYKLVATRTDFVKIEYEVSYNGKGFLRASEFNAKFSRLSSVYYFFK